MRLTTKIFSDLAIFMVMLGIIIGLIFPSLSLFLGVPKNVAFQPNYIVACIVAGIILALMNLIIAKLVIENPLRQMSQKMKYVKRTLIENKGINSSVTCSSDDCLIKVESDDELGECADAFNKLLGTLSELIQVKNEVNAFSEMLNSHIELESLAEATMKSLIEHLHADGGAILIVEKGELIIEATVGIKNINRLETNKHILMTDKIEIRQIIEYSDESLIETDVENDRPLFYIVEPIAYKDTLLGVIVLFCSTRFALDSISKLDIFRNGITLAFRNAITHRQIQSFAALDFLTGVYNRRFGSIRLREEYERSKRSDIPISILMLDVDLFKVVNDTYGHLVGDRILVNLAKVVTDAIRQCDVLLRYGGEEFICVLPGTDEEEATLVAERIRDLVMNSSISFNDKEIKVTVSIGIASLPNSKITNVEKMIYNADKAMYRAKEMGRNRVSTQYE